jgi:hypothetical protein
LKDAHISIRQHVSYTDSYCPYINKGLIVEKAYLNEHQGVYSVQSTLFIFLFFERSKGIKERKKATPQKEKRIKTK